MDINHYEKFRNEIFRNENKKYSIINNIQNIIRYN
jgi:hypothetical protein